MKIISRYLYKQFVPPLIFISIALLALWVVADSFNSIEEFVAHKAPLSSILFYFVLQVPFILKITIPIAILFSALYTLLQLKRSQELVALQSSGVSPTPIFLPLLVISCIAMLVLSWIVHFGAPKAALNKDLLERKVKGEEKNSLLILDVAFADVAHHQMWYAARFKVASLKMEDVEILVFDKKGKDHHKFFATSASYQNKGWMLKDVKVVFYDHEGNITYEKIESRIFPSELKLNPEDLLLIRNPPEELTTTSLIKAYQIQSSQHSPRAMHSMVEIVNRFAYPSLVLLFFLFAITEVPLTSTTRTPVNIFNAIFLLFGFVLSDQIFMAMGRGNFLPPFLAGILSFIIFFSYAIFRFSKKIKF